MWPNTEGVSLDNYSRAKVIRITYSEFVSVALVIQHTARMRSIVICGLGFDCNIFPHYFVKRHDFRKEDVRNIKYMY